MSSLRSVTHISDTRRSEMQRVKAGKLTVCNEVYVYSRGRVRVSACVCQRESRNRRTWWGDWITHMSPLSWLLSKWFSRWQALMRAVCLQASLLPFPNHHHTHTNTDFYPSVPFFKSLCPWHLVCVVMWRHPWKWHSVCFIDTCVLKLFTLAATAD